MTTILKVIGLLICFSSIFAFVDPDTWWFHLPVVLALGCILIGVGEACERIKSS